MIVGDSRAENIRYHVGGWNNGTVEITRPNGEVEYAELTTDKSKAGTDPLEVYKGGSKYYAKLDSKIDTHMYVEKSGVRRYVQKKMVTACIKKVSEVVGTSIPRSVGGISLEIIVGVAVVS